MQNVRRLFRWLATTIMSALLLAILAGVIGEFFIELGKEKGLYDKPSARLDAAMTAFSDLAGNTWVLVLAALFTGLTIGLWVDPILRRREERRAAIQAAQASAEDRFAVLRTGEPGSLDHMLESDQAFSDVARIESSTIAEFKRLTRYLARRKWMILFSQNNLSLRKRNATGIAEELYLASQTILTFAQQMNDATDRTRVSSLAMIADGSITTEHDLAQAYQALRVFDLISVNIAGAANLGEQAEEIFRGVRGMTRELNVAADFFQRALNDKSAAVRRYLDVCSLMREAISEKVTEAEQRLANQAGVRSPRRR